MTCQLIVNQLTVGHSWPKVFVNDFSTLMGGGGGKCFVPNAGLMHGSTRPVTTSSHWQLPRQVQPFGPGGGELFEDVLSQGYEGGANQK